MLWTAAVWLVLVVALVVLLPGYLLLQATIPTRDTRYSWTQQLYMAAAGGVLLVTLVGVILGLLPHEDRGYFSTIATGSPNVEVALAVVSVGLFYVGLHRGSYPRISARFFKKRLPQPEGPAQAAKSLQE